MIPRNVALTAVLALSGCAAFNQKFDLNNVSVSDTIAIGQDALKAATLTDEEVKQYASEMAKELDATNKIAPSGSPYAKRLETVVARYKNEDGLKLNYKVYVNSEVNAFAMADGTVRVHTGLMDKMNDEELLFVIGHEIGHVKSGHSKARLQRALAASAAVGAATSGMNGATSSSVGGVGAAIGGNIAANLISDVLQAQFSQGDETESDEYGLAFLQKGDKNPESAVKALMKLADEHGEESSTSKMLSQFTSTHPDPLARAEHLQSIIVAGGGKPFTVATNKDTAASSTDDSPVKTASAGAGSGSAGELAFGGEGTTHAPTAAPPSRVATQPPTTPKAQAGGDNGWFVQVGAFAVQDNARQVVQSVGARGNTAQIREGRVNQQRLYRVVVGPFESKDAAEREATALSDGAEVIIRHLHSL